MNKLEYSQIVRRKLITLKAELASEYGENKSKKIIGIIMQRMRQLETFPKLGIPISSMYNVESDYYYLFVQQNYFFYRILDDKTVLILEMFHEKEDFMQKLFGIMTISQETIDYWGE